MKKVNYFENLTFQAGKRINVADTIDGRYSEELHWHHYTELLVSRCDGNEATVDFSTHKLKMTTMKKTTRRVKQYGRNNAFHRL